MVAASAACVTGARSAGVPGTQVVTIQGRGNRAEGSPRRCGTGTGSRRRGARMDSQVCSFAQQPICGLRRPGQPDGEVVAEPPQLVVPAPRADLHGVIGQVGVLVAQQITHQLSGDLLLGLRHAEQLEPAPEWTTRQR